MATIGRDYEAESQIIGTENAYVTLSGTTMSYSSVLQGDAWIGFEIAVEVDFDGTPTDDVEVWWFPARDGGAPPTNPDDVGKFLGLWQNETDPNQQTKDVPASSFGRIGVVQTGATDSHDVRAYAKRYRMASA